MDDLPLFHFGAIHADPPWNFENYSDAGAGKNPSRHYDCLSLDEIKALPVGHVAAEHCVLFLWVTDPLLPEGLAVMGAWGFQYKTVAFTWAKRARVSPDKWHMGTGYWTRGNPEMCLLGVNGAPIRRDRGVKQLLVEPIRGHSRKPEQVYQSITRLVDGPYLDLFSREKRGGWTAWGNETEKFSDA